MDEIISAKLLPNEDKVKQLFENVVAAINTHSPDEIKLFDSYSYKTDEIKTKFKDVTAIFVDYFKGLNLQQPLEAYEIKAFPRLFNKKLKSIDTTMVITTKSKEPTLDYIENFITNEIANDNDILEKISQPSGKLEMMIDGTGLTSRGKGSGAGGGKRRPRRNSSSSTRRLRRGKSTSTKNYRRRRPHRRTSRK